MGPSLNFRIRSHEFLDFFFPHVVDINVKIVQFDNTLVYLQCCTIPQKVFEMFTPFLPKIWLL